MAAPVRNVWLAGLSIAAAAAVVVAGPPLVTDDPETPGRGGWEVNVSHNIETNRHERSIELPLLDINYGARDNDQLKIEFSVLSANPADSAEHWGIGDLLVGYKYRFVDEETAGWMASFYPQVSAPTGNRHLNLGSGRTELLVPFQLGKHLLEDRFFAYAEVGYSVVLGEPEANSWKFGIAGEWKASENLELVGEVGSFAFPRDAEPDDAFFNLGFHCQLAKHTAVICSAGRSFRERRDGTPDFMGFFGLQFTWGGADNDKAE